MARQIPTVTDINDQILNDYATQYGIDVSELGESERVSAKVDAGLIYPLYLLLSNVQNNIYPDLAEPEVLNRYGIAILGRYPSPATQGEYECKITGDVGTVIPAQTQFTSNVDSNSQGYVYILDSEFIIGSNPDTITLRSLTAGVVAKLTIGERLSSLQPLAGANNEVEVTAEIVIPVAAETTESYRQDILDQLRLSPQGGAPSDYRLWCNDVPEILRVYPYLQPTGLGNIDIYIEATEENSKPGEIVGTPTQATIDQVYTAPDGATSESGVVVIDPNTARGRKPLTVLNIYPKAIEPLKVDILFTDLSDIGVAETLKTQFSNYLKTIRPFIAGADVLSNKKDILTNQNMLIQAVNVTSQTNTTFTGFVIEVNDVVVESFQFIYGKIPYLGTVSNNGTPI